MTTPEELQQRRLEREISARKQAEALLEQKSLELFLEAQERQETLARLKESEERYRVMVEMSPDAILVEQHERLVFANSAARHMLAEHAEQSVVGFGLDQFHLRADVTRAARHRGQSLETTALTTDGRTIEVALSCVPITFGGKPAQQIVLRDISERKRLERQLAYQASHDPLTGMANRTALLEQLDATLAYAERHGTPVWVGFLDLDHFKQINDRFGHRAGDRLLEAITIRLRNLLRQDDIIGRYGGDEFILVMRGGTDDTLNPTMLDRIMAVARQPVDIDGYALAVTCSLGIASYPDDATDAHSLLERADAAMYRAKENGRNLYQLYNSDIHARILERVKIESALAEAIERNEFFVLYQPQVDARDGTIVGAETLLRWRHPELGILGPDRFLHFAEQSELINHIGAWVLSQACSSCATWHASGYPSVRIAVNLSVRQLNGIELIRLVDNALKSTGLPADCLVLELTESMVMSDMRLALDTLGALNERGVHLAIDDFGTGYSNFAYLNRLPLSCLKIDKQFVAEIDKPGGAMITQALIQLAHNLDLCVVAEGVETAGQLRALREQRCDQIQGWLHSKAMSAEAFLGMLRQYDPASWMTGFAMRHSPDELFSHSKISSS